MENTTLTSNSLTTDKSFNGTNWRPLNSDLNDELVFEVAQKNNISINPVSYTHLTLPTMMSV